MNVFDLSARIGLNSDDYDKGLSNAESAFSKVASGIKNGIGTIAKVTAAGFTAAATGIAALSKQAIESYADYEQLVGGVETLFKDSADKVQEYANEAYKTAGMSANEYMETVTGFSASLLQSLGGDTEKAADKANQALIDMSDNANKMGSDMEMIKNAYAGFAKQNYTMLDNLKLGYGGTKQEMERLLADAEKFSGIKYNIESYADVIDAIHVIQTEMGVTGTTAKEAASTISGSLGMMKSSWQNLITGIADDTQDFDSLVNNFVDSVDTVAQNIMPRVEQAMSGVGKLVEKLVPTIIERIPDLLENTLPALTESALKVLGTIGQALIDNSDQLLLYVVTLLDDVWNAIADSDVSTEGLSKFIETLAKRIPQISSNITMIALQLVRKLSEALQNSDSVDEITRGFIAIFYDVSETIALGIPEIAEAAFSLVKKIGQGIIDNLPWLMEDMILLVEELADYIAEAAPEMMPQIVSLVMEIAEMLTDPDTLTSLLDSALKIILALAEGLLYSLPELLKKIPVIIENLKKALIDAGPMLGKAAVELVGMLAAGLVEAIPAAIKALMQIHEAIIETIYSWGSGLFNAIKESWQEAWKALTPYLTMAKTWGNHLIENFIGGIKQKWEDLKKSVSDVAQTVKDFLGFSEPKKGPLSNFHTYAPDMMDLYSKGIKENAGKLTASLETSLAGVSDFFQPDNARTATTAATNIFNINISSDAIASDYDAYRAAQRISEELGNLQRMQALAVGA